MGKQTVAQQHAHFVSPPRAGSGQSVPCFRVVQHIVGAPARIKQLHVALLVDQPEKTPRSSEEMARITALADVFDELTRARPNTEARPVQGVLLEIASQRGKQFDPELTNLFLVMVPRLQREYGDLDAYLGQAARESPLIQARRKIATHHNIVTRHRHQSE